MQLGLILDNVVNTHTYFWWWESGTEYRIRGMLEYKPIGYRIPLIYVLLYEFPVREISLSHRDGRRSSLV